MVDCPGGPSMSLTVYRIRNKKRPPDDCASAKILRAEAGEIIETVNRAGAVLKIQSGSYIVILLLLLASIYRTMTLPVQ